MSSAFVIIMGIFGICDYLEIFKIGYLAIRFAYGLGVQYYFSYIAGLKILFSINYFY